MNDKFTVVGTNIAEKATILNVFHLDKHCDDLCS